jgi:hypothetical protein
MLPGTAAATTAGRSLLLALEACLQRPRYERLDIVTAPAASCSTRGKFHFSLPELSNSGCLPGEAGWSPAGISSAYSAPSRTLIPEHGEPGLQHGSLWRLPDAIP